MTTVATVADTLHCNFDNAVWAYELWTDPIAAAIAESVITLDRGGVTHESGSGDYAEWLEGRDASETIKFGDIVGVRGGDGFGRAIAPSALTAELSELVVGIAWGESQLEILKFVNVAVGMNPTNALRVATAQQTQIRDLETKLGAVVTKLAHLQKLEGRLNAALPKLDAADKAPTQLVAQHEE